MPPWSARPRPNPMRCTGSNLHPHDWQLLVVDLFLKEGSGLGVLRSCIEPPSLRSASVVLSNYINADIRARCLALAADAVFDKSRELRGLLRLLQSAARARIHLQAEQLARSHEKRARRPFSCSR